MEDLFDPKFIALTVALVAWAVRGEILARNNKVDIDRFREHIVGFLNFRSATEPELKHLAKNIERCEREIERFRDSTLPRLFSKKDGG